MQRHVITVVTVLGLVLSAGTQELEAQCSDSDDWNCSGSPRVCVCWDNFDAKPTAGNDFEFDSGGVQLQKGMQSGTLLQWRVWSQVSESDATPAALGPVNTPAADNFDVKILQPDGDPGASTVSSVSLDPTSASNYSNLTGAYLNDDLNGALFLQASSGGTGGQILGDVVILGDVTGAITVPKVDDILVITGTTQGAITLTDVNAPVGITGSTEGVISITNLNSSFSIGGNHGLAGQAVNITISNLDGSFDVNGSVLHSSTVVTVADIDSGGFDINGSLAGRLELSSGIPDPIGGAVCVAVNNLASTGVIDLNGGDVDGDFIVNTANAGSTIVDGGDIGSAVVYLGNQSSNYFEGTASFGSLTSHGYLTAFGTAEMRGIWNFSGDVAGELEVGGEMTSTAQINIGGDATGTISGGDGIHCDKSVAGKISITGDLLGDLQIARSLSAGGQIEIGGTCDGDISIGRDTANGSYIKLTGVGLEDNGTILVNTSDGNYNADGTIQVGPSSLPNPANDITWDGCFEVIGPSGYGKLNGRIRVTGCHANAADLNICYNSGGSGQVEIIDTGCTNQPIESCGTCP